MCIFEFFFNWKYFQLVTLIQNWFLMKHFHRKIKWTGKRVITVYTWTCIAKTFATSNSDFLCVNLLQLFIRVLFQLFIHVHVYIFFTRSVCDEGEFSSHVLAAGAGTTRVFFPRLMLFSWWRWQLWFFLLICFKCFCLNKGQMPCFCTIWSDLNYRIWLLKRWAQINAWSQNNTGGKA